LATGHAGPDPRSSLRAVTGHGPFTSRSVILDQTVLKLMMLRFVLVLLLILLPSASLVDPRRRSERSVDSSSVYSRLLNVFTRINSEMVGSSPNANDKGTNTNRRNDIITEWLKLRESHGTGASGSATSASSVLKKKKKKAMAQLRQMLRDLQKELQADTLPSSSETRSIESGLKASRSKLEKASRLKLLADATLQLHQETRKERGEPNAGLLPGQAGSNPGREGTAMGDLGEQGPSSRSLPTRPASEFSPGDPVEVVVLDGNGQRTTKYVQAFIEEIHEDGSIDLLDMYGIPVLPALPTGIKVEHIRKSELRVQQSGQSDSLLSALHLVLQQHRAKSKQLRGLHFLAGLARFNLLTSNELRLIEKRLRLQLWQMAEIESMRGPGQEAKRIRTRTKSRLRVVNELSSKKDVRRGSFSRKEASRTRSTRTNAPPPGSNRDWRMYKTAPKQSFVDLYDVDLPDLI